MGYVMVYVMILGQIICQKALILDLWLSILILEFYHENIYYAFYVGKYYNNIIIFRQAIMYPWKSLISNKK